MFIELLTLFDAFCGQPKDRVVKDTIVKNVIVENFILQRIKRSNSEKKILNKSGFGLIYVLLTPFER